MLFYSAVIGTFFGADQRVSWQAVGVNAFAAMLTSVLLLVPLLFGLHRPVTAQTPKWSRIEWAQQLLLHVYTRTSPEHAAPVLTTIGYINWWEGNGSKAHQFLQLALDTDAAYRLARLSDQWSAPASSQDGT